jgi:hypothetical protein
LAFNFNNDPFKPGPPGDTSPSPMSPMSASSPTAPDAAASTPSGTAATTPVTSDNPQSAAFVRFGSCRWQQPAEDGNQAFCTHREVKPYAGTTGFDADAWCPECQYYKLRRAPKKREPRDEYSY